MAGKHTLRSKQLAEVAKREKFITKRVATMGTKPIDSITFVNSDGRRTVQPINEHFFKNKSQRDIVKDISAIASDFKSKYIEM